MQIKLIVGKEEVKLTKGQFKQIFYAMLNVYFKVQYDEQYVEEHFIDDCQKVAFYSAFEKIARLKLKYFQK